VIKGCNGTEDSPGLGWSSSCVRAMRSSTRCPIASIFCHTTDQARRHSSVQYTAVNQPIYLSIKSHTIKVKDKGRALDIAPQLTNLRGAQVHCVHKAASHVPALYLPSYSRY